VTPEHVEPLPEHELAEPEEGFVVGGYDWLASVCNVVSAISLALIAITLIARL
jgi:hypothetical protein